MDSRVATTEEINRWRAAMEHYERRTGQLRILQECGVITPEEEQIGRLEETNQVRAAYGLAPWDLLPNSPASSR